MDHEYYRLVTRHLRPVLEVTENNYLAHSNLGIALGMKGQSDEATSQYRKAIRLKPDYAEAHNNLARALEIKNAPAGH